MSRKVSEIMTTAPVTLRSDQTVTDAAKAMREQGIGDVLVVDDGQPKGLLTDRDIAVRALAEGRDPRFTPVGEVCSADLVTVMPDADAHSAVRQMRERSVRRVPVVENGRPVGCCPSATWRSSVTSGQPWPISAPSRRISEPAAHGGGRQGGHSRSGPVYRGIGAYPADQSRRAALGTTMSASADRAGWRSSGACLSADPDLFSRSRRPGRPAPDAGRPVALAGGAAAYARGGALPLHDVDFVIREADAYVAARAFEAQGMRVEIPPEGWLIKAYDDNRLIGLIFRLSGHQDMQAVLDRAEEISVAAVPMPVLTATDLAIAWLASFSEHHADFALALTCVRPVREQVNWGRVRAETAGSAFATAFLVLLRELHVLTVEDER